MNPPNRDDDSNGAIAWRVTQLEAGMAELRKHMDERFDRLDNKMTALTFVPKDLYQSERDAMRADIKGARTLAWGCFAVLATMVLGGAMALLGRLVSA